MNITFAEMEEELQLLSSSQVPTMNITFRRDHRQPSAEAIAAPTGGDLVLGRIASTWANRHGKLERARRVISAPLLPPLLVWAMVLSYVVLMLRLVFFLYDTMNFQSGWDLGIFDQAAWLISRGQRPFASARGIHILSDHFSAMMYLLAPLYWLWDSAKVLLTAQTVGLALGALPVYALAKERLQSAWWGVLFAGVYLLYPLLQWANTFEFHPDSLITPLLLTAFWALRRRRWAIYFLCLLGAALTKEHVGPTVCMLGVWVWWSVDRRIGWLTLGAGVFFVLLAFGTVRYFNNGAPTAYYLLYAKYGNSLPSMVMGALENPGRVWADVSAPDRREYLGHLGGPLMYLPLLSPSLLLAAAPAFASNLLSSRGIMHTLNGGYYSALIVPFLFAAAIESCRRLQGFLGRRGMAVVGANLALWSLLSAPKGALWDQNRAFAGDSPDKERVNQEKMRSAQVILQAMPLNASISAQIALTPYLNRRTRLFTFPNPFLERGWGNTLKARRELEEFGGFYERPPHLQADVDAAKVEYVALLPRTNTFPLTQSNFEEVALAVFKSPSYGIVFINRHAVLLRRHAPRRQGWRLLARAAGTPVSSEQQMEAAFWTWMAL